MTHSLDFPPISSGAPSPATPSFLLLSLFHLFFFFNFYLFISGRERETERSIGLLFHSFIHSSVPFPSLKVGAPQSLLPNPLLSHVPPHALWSSSSSMISLTIHGEGYQLWLHVLGHGCPGSFGKIPVLSSILGESVGPGVRTRYQYYFFKFLVFIPICSQH